jgi:hypothetical protein
MYDFVIGDYASVLSCGRHRGTQIEQPLGKGTGGEGKFTWKDRMDGMGEEKSGHRLTPTNTDWGKDRILHG